MNKDRTVKDFIVARDCCKLTYVDESAMCDSSTWG